jgi:fermentation-respiration switch protein FrsA (DUF1100 family)
MPQRTQQIHHRYNLLREQAEGYGKLLAALLSGGPLAGDQAGSLARTIKSLVGAFNLDPNRCVVDWFSFGFHLVFMGLAGRVETGRGARVGVAAWRQQVHARQSR